MTMPRYSCKVFLSLTLVIAAWVFLPQSVITDEAGCYSIVVGKNASSDGWIIMAHNEDDYIPQIVNHHKVPRKTHAKEEIVQLINGGSVDEVSETWSYIWSEIPDLLFSDSYLNEWGVCVCSNACPSREDRPTLVDGGITYMLRRLIAERAITAREGVHLAGYLIEEFGYASSGRTYVISDPEEGWLLCAVNGTHWIAQRVPDNEVALIANTYTVHAIDLSDTVNFLGSPDIVDYAIERGWYDPKADGEFDFAAAYADPDAASDFRNIGRQWDGIRLVGVNPPAYGEPLPFSITPKENLDVSAVMKILRSHYEGTELYAVDTATGCPHANPVMPVCRHDTQTSFVAQLRRGIPRDVGLVYWVCLSSPCASCYVPFHFGIKEFPGYYAGERVQPSREYYDSIINRPFTVDSGSAFWTHVHLKHLVEQRYVDMAETVRQRFDSVEADALSRQGSIEAQVVALPEGDPGRAKRLLMNYSESVYEAATDVLSWIAKWDSQ